MLSTESTNTYGFSFYGDANYLDPHSFPTRRSSDLACARTTTSIGSGTRCPTTCGERWRSHRARRSDGDRKSTRLNSSHVAIAYAVVCLKKKTVPVRPDVRPARLLHAVPGLVGVRSV